METDSQGELSVEGSSEYDSIPTAAPDARSREPRVVGRYRGGKPGPTLMVVAGIHGNEPAGVQAARRVFETLGRRRPHAAGQFVVFVGNTRALAQGIRFLEDDLNRIWTLGNIETLTAAARPDLLGPEEQELLELLAALNQTLGESTGRVHLMDLHTTSGSGGPFATIGDTLRNRAFALKFPLPVILGLEEQIDGPLLEYMNNRGVVTMGVEGGQHASEAAVDNHEAVLWLALCGAGVLREEEVPELEEMRARLERENAGAPGIVEVRHRHAIRPDDQFVMEPGFRNFQRVERGTLLARDRRRAIHAKDDGVLLMPLYQGQGDDGFFMGRSVKRRWLRLSTFLRKLHLDWAIPLLPGVWRHPERENELIINTRVARFYPLEIFHLLGYRRRRWIGPVLVVSRRRFDRKDGSPGWG